MVLRVHHKHVPVLTALLVVHMAAKAVTLSAACLGAEKLQMAQAEQPTQQPQLAVVVAVHRKHVPAQVQPLQDHTTMPVVQFQPVRAVACHGVGLSVTVQV